MTEIGSLEFASLFPARSIRQRVRYSIGDAPTVSLNLRANVDRDMSARCASSCNVQPCAGSSCTAAKSLAAAGAKVHRGAVDQRRRHCLWSRRILFRRQRRGRYICCQRQTGHVRWTLDYCCTAQWRGWSPRKHGVPRAKCSRTPRQLQSPCHSPRRLGRFRGRRTTWNFARSVSSRAAH
jgi:hypothetical protein